MGCKTSSDQDQQDSGEMTTIKIPAHDTFWETTALIIAKMDRIKENLSGNVTKMCDMTKAKYLKEPNLQQATKLWLSGIAANNEGELLKSGKVDITE
jgi:hypothetical protein